MSICDDYFPPVENNNEDHFWMGHYTQNDNIYRFYISKNNNKFKIRIYKLDTMRKIEYWDDDINMLIQEDPDKTITSSKIITKFLKNVLSEEDYLLFEKDQFTII